MQGLTLAIHRIDKAASVEKSRKKKVLINSEEWKALSAPAQAARLAQLANAIDATRTVKKKEARRQWIALHTDCSEVEDGDRAEVLDAVDSNEEGSDMNMVMEIEGVEDEDEDENEDEFSDEGEGSEGEEGPDEGEAELDGEDKATAMGDLTVAFNKQREDAREFYAALEAAAMAMASEETLADWAF